MIIPTGGGDLRCESEPPRNTVNHATTHGTRIGGTCKRSTTTSTVKLLALQLYLSM